MVNRVTLIGRLGKDPVIKHFSNDNAIAEFSLATDESYKNKEGQKVEQTEWHNIKIPTKGLAGIAEKYLKKGSLLYVEGKIRTRNYDDKDGNKKYITEIICESFKMLDGTGKKNSGDNEQHQESHSQSQSSGNGNGSQSNSNSDSDDLPF